MLSSQNSLQFRDTLVLIIFAEIYAIVDLFGLFYGRSGTENCYIQWAE